MVVLVCFALEIYNDIYFAAKYLVLENNIDTILTIRMDL